MTESLDVHKIFADYFAGIEAWAFAVSSALEQGSMCLDIDGYQEALANQTIKNPYLEEDEGIRLDILNNSDHVTLYPENELKPFVLVDGKLYMQRYYVYQTKIVENIKVLIATEKSLIEERMTDLNKNRDFINRLFKQDTTQNQDQLSEMEKIDWQKVAALNACLNNFSIITGGPGTGKTTTVAKILAILFHLNSNLKVALAAPTGKAAARLGESLHHAKETISGLSEEIKNRFDSIVPKTIHRLLAAIPNSNLFRHKAKNPLEYDLVIIDEASMIDGALMYKLLVSIPSEKRIIFLGDKNQLASVQAGSIFGDLCRTQGELMNHLYSNRFEFCNQYLENKMPGKLVTNNGSGNLLSQHIIQLFRNYRSESYEISSLCNSIIENTVTTINNAPGKINYDQEYNQSFLNELAQAYLEYIQEPSITAALLKLTKFRALCAVREGKHGVYQINKNIERLLKTRVNDINLFNPTNSFYHNQVIMVTSNNYELKVFNGDTGIIRRKSITDDTLIAYFESEDADQPKEILPGYLNDYETVYAMTIHKSQGSEFDTVAVILPENENTNILTRELLYTAVSRAKKEVLIQSHENVLRSTISREVSRASGISNQF